MPIPEMEALAGQLATVIHEMVMEWETNHDNDAFNENYPFHMSLDDLEVSINDWHRTIEGMVK
jgi:hypothetical protein